MLVLLIYERPSENSICDLCANVSPLVGFFENDGDLTKIVKIIDLINSNAVVA